MSIPFTFPAPLDVFAGYQETLIGRPLSVDEKELTAAWLDIINQAKPKDIPFMDELIAKNSGDDDIIRCLTAVKAWMFIAAGNSYAQGRRDAQQVQA